VSLTYISPDPPKQLALYHNNIDVTASVPVTINGVLFYRDVNNTYGAPQWVVSDTANGITIYVLDQYYMSATVCASSALYGQITGLMGLFDGNPDNDGVSTMSQGFTTLSGGEDWRVPQVQSSTHYSTGETYNSINDPGFIGAVFDNNFAPSVTAQQACAAIANTFKPACLQDVTTTGSTAFAVIAKSMSEIVSNLDQVYGGGSSTGGSSGSGTSDASTVRVCCAVLIVVLLAVMWNA